MSIAPERLTSLPGDEIEAAWSPDGRNIVFEYVTEGRYTIRALDIKDRQVRNLVSLPGRACYPAWSPDGAWVVFSYGRFTTTAMQAEERKIAEGFNLYRVPAVGGVPERLTSGRYRDYTPQVDPQGRWLWFTSTRGLHMTSAALFRMPWRESLSERVRRSPPRHVFGADGHSSGAMEPCPSPDGRYIVFTRYSGIRGLWRLWLLDADTPSRRALLTDADFAAYAPAWSPDGRYIACTGYRDGDPGWGLYLIDPRTGADVRIDTGPGNSRSPAWSPDGRFIVFENDRSGSYDLCRIPTPRVSFPAPSAAEANPVREPILHLDFSRAGPAAFRDCSKRGNDAAIEGTLPRTDDGGLVFGKGNLRIPQPDGSDFGKGAFSVTVRLKVLKHTNRLRLIVVGDHPENHLGWQIFLHPNNVLYFNARSPSGNFVGVCTPAPLPVGKVLTVTGCRANSGTVVLLIDGREIGRNEGAAMSYSRARQVRIGCQFNGTSPFESGVIYSVEVGRGLPPQILTRAEQLRKFYGK